MSPKKWLRRVLCLLVGHDYESPRGVARWCRTCGHFDKPLATPRNWRDVP